MDIFQTLYDTLRRNGLLFCYNGFMSQNVIAVMAETLRQQLEAHDTKGATSRKIFSTFVEMAQNIVNYGVDTESAENIKQHAQGGVAIGQRDGRFYIICGNHIDRTQLERVRAKLESIRAMSPEEIKHAYKQQLRNDEHTANDSVSKGAGLGFLTVARDASEPIEFCFIEDENLNEKVAFYLKIVI